MSVNGEVLIKVEEIHKIYGELHALDGISEEIRKGEVVVIVGSIRFRKINFSSFFEFIGSSGKRTYLF